MSLDKPSDLLIQYLCCLRIMEAINPVDYFYQDISNRAEDYYWKLDKDERRIVDSDDINWRPILERASAGENLLWFIFKTLSGDRDVEFKGHFLDFLQGKN